MLEFVWNYNKLKEEDEEKYVKEIIFEGNKRNIEEMKIRLG
jgi:hypothetical protein